MSSHYEHAHEHTAPTAVRQGLACLTLEQVAKIVGLTKQRVYQIEVGALRKMARHPEIRKLARDFNLFQAEERQDPARDPGR